MEKLFYEHEQLCKSLIKRENIKIEQWDVEQAAEFMEEKVLEIKEKSFEDVKNLLLELSALFGAVANQFHPCQWKLQETLILNCDLEFLKVKSDWNRMDISDILLSGWKEKEEKRTKNNTNFCEKRDRFMNLNVTYPPIEIKKELLKKYNQVT